jgi:hypothetical protein
VIALDDTARFWVDDVVVILEVDTSADEVGTRELMMAVLVFTTMLELDMGVLNGSEVKLRNEVVVVIALNGTDRVWADDVTLILELVISVAEVSGRELILVVLLFATMLELVMEVLDRIELELKSEVEVAILLDDTIGAGTILPPHTPVFLFGEPTVDFR